MIQQNIDIDRNVIKYDLWYIVKVKPTKTDPHTFQRPVSFVIRHMYANRLWILTSASEDTVRVVTPTV